MSRSVVCGVDWSEESIAAATVAAELSRRLRAVLIVAHVVEERPTFPYGDETELNRSRHRAHDETTLMFDRLKPRLAVEFDPRVLFGAPADELADVAEEEDAALLVVGSRGRRAVKAALFGSVSSALSRTSDRPIVIVRGDAVLSVLEPSDESRKIVCGVDDSPHARGAATVAATLAAGLDAELVLVHAYLPARSAASIPAGGVGGPVDHAALEAEQRRHGERLLREIAGQDAAARLPMTTRLEAGAPAAVLERCARTDNAALIVIGTHGRGPIASALFGSTSVALAAEGPVPVVMVSERAALRATQAAVGGRSVSAR